MLEDIREDFLGKRSSQSSQSQYIGKYWQNSFFKEGMKTESKPIALNRQTSELVMTGDASGHNDVIANKEDMDAGNWSAFLRPGEQVVMSGLGNWFFLLFLSSFF